MLWAISYTLQPGREALNCYLITPCIISDPSCLPPVTATNPAAPSRNRGWGPCKPVLGRKGSWHLCLCIFCPVVQILPTKHQLSKIRAFVVVQSLHHLHVSPTHMTEASFGISSHPGCARPGSIMPWVMVLKTGFFFFFLINLMDKKKYNLERTLFFWGGGCPGLLNIVKYVYYHVLIIYNDGFHYDFFIHLAWILILFIPFCPLLPSATSSVLLFISLLTK